MSQITYECGDYWVSVSSHGYFRVLSKAVPAVKFTDLPGTLYEGSVSQLDGGIRYNGEYDDVEPDIEDERVKTACEGWVGERLVWLARLDKSAARQWEKRKATPIIVDGETFYVGGRVATPFGEGTLLALAPARDGHHLVTVDHGAGAGTYLTGYGNPENYVRPA